MLPDALREGLMALGRANFLVTEKGPRKGDRRKITYELRRKQILKLSSGNWGQSELSLPKRSWIEDRKTTGPISGTFSFSVFESGLTCQEKGLQL